MPAGDKGDCPACALIRRFSSSHVKHHPRLGPVIKNAQTLAKNALSDKKKKN